MSMTSRERLLTTLDHRQPDRVCVDVGSTAVSGISASALTRLARRALGDPGYIVKVHEPYQMLGLVEDSVAEALGIDTTGVGDTHTLFGFEAKDWKPFALFDGTEVLVPGDFNVSPDEKGGLYLYPCGNTNVAPSGYMPRGGFYFDAVCRQAPIDEGKLDPADNLIDFAELSDEDVRGFADRAREGAATGRGVVLSVPGTSFGDIALVPAMWLEKTPGIRGVEEWYMSTMTRRDYVQKVFEGQCEVAVRNLEKLAPALGDNVQVAFITGTDFGTQQCLFASVDTYRDLYKPFHKIINDFVHRNTNWKTFIHSCGAVKVLIPEFIDAGFDILNPVQCSAVGMDAAELKREFGRDIVFWGGGVDTQKTLPFGTADEVYDEVRKRIDILGRDGGFVFNTVHNIQANSPVENLEAMFRAIRESAG